jgi:hypothetical protein
MRRSWEWQLALPSFASFFVLVRSGKGKDHVGAYYFQTRPDPTVTYIASLGGARWENWWHDWVIACTEVSDRLALPSDGPRLGQKQWREKPCLVPEFEPILDRIKELAVGDLTSMHVLGDFLKRRVMPLQGRPCLCCWFTGPSDIGRILRGPGTDLTREELGIFVRGITGEAFIPESLMPPQGIFPLCDNPGLRSAVLARLSTLDESGVAVCQTGGRDPHQGIHIPGTPAGGPQPADVAPRVPPVCPSSSDKGNEPACSSSTPDAAERSGEERRHRLRRADGSFVSDPPLDLAAGRSGEERRHRLRHADGSFVSDPPLDLAAGRSGEERRHRLRHADGSFVSDPPLDSGSSQKRQKTAGGAKEAEPQVQDGQRGASPPSPPPSDLTPPPPPPVTDRPSSPQGQRQQRQRAPRFQGHWEVHGPK